MLHWELGGKISWDVTPCSGQRLADTLAEHATSIFWVHDGGNRFLQNVGDMQQILMIILVFRNDTPSSA